MADSNLTTPAEIAILAGAAVAVVGSLLTFSGSITAWGSGSFPIVTLVPIYLAATASQVAIERFGGIDLPDEVGLGFNWRQLHVALAALSTLMMLAWVFQPPERSIGLWLMLIGSVVVLAGAVGRERLAATRGIAVAPGPSPTLSPASIAILAGAAVLMVGSFLKFWKVSSTVAGIHGGFSAWSFDLGFAPVSLLPVLCGVLLALYVLVSAFAGLDLPTRAGGLTLEQMSVALGLHTVVMMLAFLIVRRPSQPVTVGGALARLSYDLGLGFWLMLLGSLVLAAGVVLRHREVAPAE